MNRSWLGVVDTIYEEEGQEEEEEESHHSCSDSDSSSCVDARQKVSSQSLHTSWIVTKDEDTITSDRSSSQGDEEDDHDPSLQQIIASWSEATGITASITIRIGDRIFVMHRFPLVSRSGYFKRELMKRNEICLNPPGGVEMFEMVARYCYGFAIFMVPSTVVAIRCASEFYEMTEDYHRENLCSNSQTYFEEVVIKHWEGAIEALKSCQGVMHPMAQQLDIVGDCVESLAFHACSEINRGRELKTLYGIADEEDESWIIHDLITLPFDYFKQVMEAVRRHTGIYESFIGRSLVLYSDKWVLDGTLDCDENQMRRIVESIVRLLPVEKEEICAPVGFLFSLLRCALAWKAGKECRMKLEIKVAAQLENAKICDMIVPFGPENGWSVIESMRRVVALFVSQQSCVGDDSDHTAFSDQGNATSEHSSGFSNHSCAVCWVANVWDEYVANVAMYPSLSSARFMELVETVPSSWRLGHDHLYWAIHVFLKNHGATPQQEKDKICGMLSYGKMSREVCMHAVKNEVMPLRMLVQAMYAHRVAAKNDSSKTVADTVLRRPSSLRTALRREAMARQTETLKTELQHANSRLKELEHEISAMKRKLNSDFRKSNDDDDVHGQHDTQKNSIGKLLLESLQKLNFWALKRSKKPSTRKGDCYGDETNGGFSKGCFRDGGGRVARRSHERSLSMP